MVSSRKSTEAPPLPCSSYRDPWERQQAPKTADRARNRGEQLSVEGEREVARRVLEDLERLYFDGTDDEESEEEEDLDSDSEWGFDTSSCSSGGKRTTGGLTLEELTVAVNAAIEYHRPAMNPIPQPVTKTKEDDNISYYSVDRRRSSSRHQRKDQSAESPESGELVLEMFQNMLERKEKYFYDLRAMNAATGDNNQQEIVVAVRNATMDQQQQTTAYVRDQATETEENLQHPLDISLVADFQSPVNSLSSRTHSRHTASQSKPMRRIEVGPTLADLARSHRRREKPRSSRSASESSWGSSSSSVTDRLLSVSRASLASGRSSCSSNISSKTSSRMSRQSGSSHQSSSKSQSQPGIDPKDRSFTQSHKDEVSQAASPPPSVESSHVPSNPADVKWELDLSNFAF
ncbi:hypothetical protein V7S43_003207 [Phytophthora oleae]|uniref:Uncharacterized protein n=1 Tax=Phytophthora oleae TaxID=2107226 RepID=A0ABD3FZR1_9STRA